MKRLVPRREFLVQLMAATGGLLATLVGQGASASPDRPVVDDPRERAKPPLPIFKLDSTSASNDPYGPGCNACRACHGHGKNRLFATEAAALRGDYRAHGNCRCQVVAGGTLPHNTWVALFGQPDHLRHEYVDKRWPWVKAILRRSPQPHAVS